MLCTKCFAVHKPGQIGLTKVLSERCEGASRAHKKRSSDWAQKYLRETTAPVNLFKNANSQALCPKTCQPSLSGKGTADPSPGEVQVPVHASRVEVASPAPPGNEEATPLPSSTSSGEVASPAAAQGLAIPFQNTARSSTSATPKAKPKPQPKTKPKATSKAKAAGNSVSSLAQAFAKAAKP